MNKLIKYLQFDKKEDSIFVPNEIFKDIENSGLSRSQHIAFAYSYYYLSCWLYRYAKYGQVYIDTKIIKQVLGYSADSKEINHIIKKNGVLDEIGYTISSTDYPIVWTFEQNELEFTMISDLELEMRKMVSQPGRNYKIKVPVKALWRDKESEDDNYYNGTFYDVSNTHLVPFDIFSLCMRSKSLGCTGFYVYGYLKYRCQWFDQYKSSIERISNEINISKGTTEKYLYELSNRGLIKCIDNGYKTCDEKPPRKEANSYVIA